MQQLIRARDALPTPARKPVWWQIVLGVAMVAGVGAAWGLQIALGTAFHPLVPISGALAGGLLAMAILGFRLGRYRVVETDEKLTMWLALAPLWRGGALAASLVIVAGALALASFAAESRKAKPAATPPGAPTTPVKPAKK